MEHTEGGGVLVCRSDPTGDIRVIRKEGRLVLAQALIKEPAGSRKGLKAMHERKRGKVKGRSRKSFVRLLWTLARVCGQFSADTSFVTLTVGKDPPAWPEAHRRFHAWTKVLRRRDPHGWGIWCGEAQKRGAPHFHLLWVNNLSVWAADLKAAWVGKVLDTGSTREALEAHAFDLRFYEYGESETGLQRYMAKVAAREISKSRQIGVEVHMGRTWGIVNRDGYRAACEEEQWLFRDPDDVAEYFRDQAVAGMLQGERMNAAVVADAEGTLYRVFHASSLAFDDNALFKEVDNGR